MGEGGLDWGHRCGSHVQVLVTFPCTPTLDIRLLRLSSEGWGHSPCRTLGHDTATTPEVGDEPSEHCSHHTPGPVKDSESTGTTIYPGTSITHLKDDKEKLFWVPNLGALLCLEYFYTKDSGKVGRGWWDLGIPIFCEDSDWVSSPFVGCQRYPRGRDR